MGKPMVQPMSMCPCPMGGDTHTKSLCVCVSHATQEEIWLYMDQVVFPNLFVSTHNQQVPRISAYNVILKIIRCHTLGGKSCVM